MALTDKLTAIGDAIREKTGGTDKLTLDEMVTEISSITSGSGEEYFTDEDLVFNEYCDYLFAYDRWKPVLEKEKLRIKISKPRSLNNLLQNSSGEDYSFLTIEGNPSVACRASNLFSGLKNVKKLPKISNLYINGNQTGNIFSEMHNFNDINECINFFDNIKFNNSSFQTPAFFSYCHSLRNVDAVMPYLKKALAEYNAGANYAQSFYRTSALDEINNIPILFGTKTYNGFNQVFKGLSRVKNITFETDNGTPYVVEWKAQVIELSSGSSLGVGMVEKNYTSYILNYNSGITADKEVTNDSEYQLLKDDADWWTIDMNYSRYNHDSAVNTINSLPDTSAYLASAGGTNTIKFLGGSGALTDGGAINTLTEEEIAVATAKGWTVTFT